MKALELGNSQVKADVIRIAGPYSPEGWLPDSAQSLCARVLSTVYMGMEVKRSS
jgi:NAD+ synthase (glutamine-hydrolysing)